jgi:hypothetical protein
MSYRCGICQDVVSGGQPQKRHVVKRPDGNIAREVPVCGECHAALRSGYTLQQMVAIRGRKAVDPPTAVAVQSAPRQAPTQRAPAVKKFVPFRPHQPSPIITTDKEG